MNPYGITQVDVPGLLAVYQGAQDRRAQQMLAKRQQEAADRQADRDQRFDEILAKGMGGGMGGAYGSQPQAPQGGMGTIYGGAQGQAPPADNPAPAMQPRTNFQLDPQTAAQLIALKPEEAGQIIGAFSKMNEAQHAASQQVNETLGRAAQYLLGVPEQERAAELQRITPELLRHGIDPQQIQGFQPTNRNLESMVAQSRDIEKLREESRPKLRNVGPGDMIIDENRIGGSQSPTVYESPYIKGPDGAIYERPQSAPQQQTAVNPQTGETVVYNPQSGQWEPMNSAPPPVSAAPPRASAAEAEAALKAARAEGNKWLREQGMIR